MTSIKLSEVKIGDIIGIRTYNWLGKRIQWFLKVQSRLFFRKKLDVTYNHSMVVVLKKDSIITVGEAVSRGFVIQPIHYHYSMEDLVSNAVVYRPKPEFSISDKIKIQNKAASFANSNIEYEFPNFLWWAVYIFSVGLIDIGPSKEKSENKLFCHEVGGILWNEVRSFFKNSSRVTTVDFELNCQIETYKIKY